MYMCIYLIFNKSDWWISSRLYIRVSIMANLIHSKDIHSYYWCYNLFKIFVLSFLLLCVCAVYSSITFLVRHILLPFRVTSPTLRVEYPLRSLAGQSVATKSHALLKMRSKLWYSDGHAALWTSAGQVGLFEILFGVTKYIHIISCRKHYVCKERVDHLYILHNIHTQSSVTYHKSAILFLHPYSFINTNNSISPSLQFKLANCKLL